MDYHRFRSMDTEVVLAAEGSKQQVAFGFQVARGFIEESAMRFTRFSPQSELSALNRSAGSWFQASPDLFDLLQQAQECHRRTNGLFDPAILPDLLRAGYDRDMAQIRRHGAAPQLRAQKSVRPSFAELRLDQATRRIWLPAGMEIDLGGIAKGWIAGQAARRLAQFSSAGAVSAGGDMALTGVPADGFWEIELEDPCDPERSIALLRVGAGALATSSITKRTWQQGEKRQHHLIDPRSGEPAQTAWLSATVVLPQVSPDNAAAVSAEAFAKALLIAGPQAASTWGGAAENVAFILVDAQGKLWGSKNSTEYFYVNA